MPAWGWIEQSDAHIIQNTEQTDWQLLGPSSYESPWKRGSGRGRKGRIVGGCGDALSAVYCYCAWVIAGGQVCQDRAGFPQRPQPLCWNAQEEIQPRGGKDRSTDTRYVHSALESGLLRKTGQTIEQPVWNHSTSSGVTTTLRDSFTMFLHNPMKTTVSVHLWTTWLYTNGLDEWHELIFLFVCFPTRTIRFGQQSKAAVVEITYSFACPNPFV